MARVLETHQFGTHHVAVVEQLEDDGISYSVLVDDQPVTDESLNTPPSFEDVVRLYSQHARQPAEVARSGA